MCRLNPGQLERLRAALEGGPAAWGWVQDQRWTLARVTTLIALLFHTSTSRYADASGFLVNDMALDDILSAIRVIALGDALIAPGVTVASPPSFAHRPGPAPPQQDIEGITERRREVVAIMRSGIFPTARSAPGCPSALPRPRPT